MKIVTIVGARPQFIKASAFSRAVKRYAGVEEVIVHTGQHFDKNMSDIFFEEMEIPTPKYNLEIHSLSHGAMTGRMIEEIEKVLVLEKPDVLLVYGDTNSTLAGALAAKKMHIKVAHVEAGLRSFNMRMPEEVNRILTDRISDYLFCPTDTAVKNLKNEGYANIPCDVVRTGDVMYDAALFYAKKAEVSSTVLSDLGVAKNEYILATIHRQENTDDENNLKNIVAALNEINARVRVVIPLHPRTRKILEQQSITPEFTIIDPVGYIDMVQLTANAKLVMTDSGGLQKEAFFFQKNCVTMREQTEWIELVENGFNVTTGAVKEKILEGFNTMLNKQNDFSVNLYGTGNASAEIVEHLLRG
jgi:UDP-GlcNAc3NAcA epimerase